jgi:hypothetical protein
LDKAILSQKFAIQSKVNGRFLRASQNFNDSLKTNSKLRTELEMFEAVILRDNIFTLGGDSSRASISNTTQIAFKSVATRKYLSVNGISLYANRDYIGDGEKFKLKFGQDNCVGFFSTRAKKFLTAFPNQNKPLILNRDHFLDWEMFYLISF